MPPSTPAGKVGVLASKGSVAVCPAQVVADKPLRPGKQPLFAGMLGVGFQKKNALLASRQVRAAAHLLALVAQTAAR